MRAQISEEYDPHEQNALRTPVLRASILNSGQDVYSEELYTRRQRFNLIYPADQATCIIVLHGSCALSTSDTADPFLLSPERSNFLFFSNRGHTFSVLRPPLHLLRIRYSALAFESPQFVALQHRFKLVLPLFRLLLSTNDASASCSNLDSQIANTFSSYLLDELASLGIVPVSVDPLIRFKDWVLHNFHRPIDMPTISAAIHLSPRRIQELCQVHLKCTPLQFVRSCRLSSFRANLVDPAFMHLTIGELMRNNGLPDSAATRRLFSLRYGVTPISLRKGSSASS